MKTTGYSARMSRTPILLLFFGIAAVLVTAPYTLHAVTEAKSLPETGKGNPHLGIPCGDCHREIPEKGKIAAKTVMGRLRKPPVELCRDCHPEASHHPVARKAERKIPEDLPLGPGGDVICSTCHDIHMKKAVPALLRGYDMGRYAVRMDMCLDCHGERFNDINPHRIESESEKCSTCHPSRPVKGDKTANVPLQDKLVQICNFCHNVKEKEHPLNVDPLRKIPDRLPRSRSGGIMCGTCHDPHGTEGTLHFLRKDYVEFLETGRYMNPHERSDYAGCLGCHLEMATRKEDMRKNLRFQGDDLLICHSCHGGMDSCHPILVKLGPGMNPGKGLPLTADGKIKCLTCHNPTVEGGSGVAMRERAPEDPVNTICFRCHNKVDLLSRNPHSSMTDRESCKFCHDTMTDPTNEEAARVSFISNTRLICLRCHPQEKHPAGVNHMVVPAVPLREPFRADSKGRITCTTCHNPHIDVRGEEKGKEEKKGEKSGKKRFVVEQDDGTICTLCHRRE
jgi:hypothetical protein